MERFDEKTISELGVYVYMLLDPEGYVPVPFYVGKGSGNRIFDHLNCALKDEDEVNAKYETIRSILLKGQRVKHCVVRHGLTEEDALEIEASLIDALNFIGHNLSNRVFGHHSNKKGLMTTDEISRLYSAEPLTSIDSDCVIININKKYKRGFDYQAIYNATKEIWTIDKRKVNSIKYVLSEYRGLIVEVFEVVKPWYEKERGYNKNAKKQNQTKIGYGFNGVMAPAEIRDKYINKSINHVKKRGAASVIRYNLN